MVLIASDHAGFQLKEEIKKYFSKNNISFEDLGPFSYDINDDYPDFIYPLAQKVVNSKALGIGIGGSGQGEAMVANKVNGIRAVVYYGGPLEIVKLSREHNDSNFLALGARFLTPEKAIQAVKIWLQTSFSNQLRHKRRLEKISRLENS